MSPASTPSLIVVAGLGRCGTSAVMEMLDAAGIPIHHDGKDIPKFESDDVMRLPGDSAWLDDLAPGTALKVIGPQKYPLPKDRRYRFIFMRRNHRQQALSTMTFQGVMTRRQLAFQPQKKCLIKAEPAALREIASHGATSPILQMRFEDLIRRPDLAAGRIARFLELPDDAVPSMAAVVWERRPEHAGRMMEFERRLPAG